MDSGTDALPRKFNFKRIGGVTSAPEEDEVVVNRFNVFVFEDYEKELRLRPSLFKSRPEKDLQRDVILITSLGMWAMEVGICRCHQKWTLCGESWEDFTRRHFLRAGDVIWFEVVGDMVWRAHMFDHFSMCEKVLTMPGEAPSSTFEAGPAKKKKGKTKVGDREEETDQFTVKINELQVKSNYLNLPRSFVKANACVNMCQRAILVDSRGNAWETEIYYPGAKQKDLRYVQFKGWNPFAKAHGLQIGDTCTLRLDDESRLSTSSSFVVKVEIRK